MTVLMGENMMRKDGKAHFLERKQAFPALSPKTVRHVWKDQFIADTNQILENLADRKEFDLVKEFAMPVCGNALRHITGLTNISVEQMDIASQSMIDGVGNYQNDPDIEARCKMATALLDDAIDNKLENGLSPDHTDMLAVLSRSGQPLDSIRANIKLAISGGQNEPRDAIAGSAWSLLTHPEQLQLVRSGEATWYQVFEEYARWISPIGMSPRRVTQEYQWKGVDLEADDRVFFMFGSANRDETVFECPELFDVCRNTSKAISFGAGPHFCAGAAASRSLIAEVALPMLFERFPTMTLNGKTKFAGWAFRGPLEVPTSIQ